MHQEEREIENAESIVSTETCKKQRCWSKLPSLALENIYSFLDIFDRVQMSLVCREWSEGYGSPSAWETFKFDLKEPMISMNSYPGEKFVRKYSNLFRRVDIHYHTIHPSKKDLIDIWCRHFIVFLQVLTSNSQLISLKIQRLFLCFAEIDTTTRSNVKRAIESFLRSQNYLKRVELHDCFDKLEEYTELLQQLTESSRNSIGHFRLRGLVCCDPYHKERNLTAEYSLVAFIVLPSLTTLAIDYSLIFENTFKCQSAVMKTLKDCQTRATLSKIILNYDRFCDIELFHGFTSTDWQFLKNLYPDLQVELTCTIHPPSLREAGFLIVPDMPLTRLNYTYEDYNLDYNCNLTNEIDAFFARLIQCNTTDHLVSFSLKWEQPIPDLASLIPFLRACKKLKCLDLFITYPANGIDLLLNFWLENRPISLKEVFIQIAGVEDDHHFTLLEKLTTEYVSHLKFIGLSVKVDLCS